MFVEYSGNWLAGFIIVLVRLRSDLCIQEFGESNDYL